MLPPVANPEHIFFSSPLVYPGENNIIQSVRKLVTIVIDKVDLVAFNLPYFSNVKRHVAISAHDRRYMAPCALQYWITVSEAELLKSLKDCCHTIRDDYIF